MVSVSAIRTLRYKAGCPCCGDIPLRVAVWVSGTVDSKKKKIIGNMSNIL